MLRTRVGYAGGTQPDPTYRRIGDHTEVFQVDYDPARITFAKLLDVFWDSHSPCSGSWSTQYQSILFYMTDAEREIAKASAAAVEARLGKPVRTALRRLDRFYRAEDYHQKYALQRERELCAQVRALFDSEQTFAESTAAARLNAYLDGELSYERLREELAALGLRAIGTAHLERVEVAPPREAPASRPASQPMSQPALR